MSINKMTHDARKAVGYQETANQPFKSGGLSLQAMGLASYLMHKAHDFSFTLATLKAQIPGRGHEAAYRELRQAGHITVSDVHQPNGTFRKVSTFHEVSVTEGQFSEVRSTEVRLEAVRAPKVTFPSFGEVPQIDITSSLTRDVVSSEVDSVSLTVTNTEIGSTNMREEREETTNGESLDDSIQAKKDAYFSEQATYLPEWIDARIEELEALRLEKLNPTFRLITPGERDRLRSAFRCLDYRRETPRANFEYLRSLVLGAADLVISPDFARWDYLMQSEDLYRFRYVLFVGEPAQDESTALHHYSVLFERGLTPNRAQLEGIKSDHPMVWAIHEKYQALAQDAEMTYA